MEHHEMVGSAHGHRSFRWGSGLLLVAAILVGLAIAAEDGLARALNGVGGGLWLIAAALLAWSVRSSMHRLRATSVTAAVVIFLALVVRPSELTAALIGFSIGGATVALIVRHRPLRWVMLMAAAWLPAHLVLAISRSMLSGDVRVRTDPPPTAALVPLTMVLAAAAGGAIIARVRSGQREERVLDAAGADGQERRDPGDTLQPTQS
jgi:hypothetical protein